MYHRKLMHQQLELTYEPGWRHLERLERHGTGMDHGSSNPAGTKIIGGPTLVTGQIGGPCSNTPSGEGDNEVSSFLMQWHDPGLTVNEEDTADSLVQEERQRLAKMLAVAEAAQTVPRRLGADATPDELAADKRRSRRIAHVARQCATAWGKIVSITGDVSREAAQVNWSQWWETHKTWLINRIKYIVAWAQKTGADEKWTKSTVVKLTNELTWLTYAMREG